MLRPRFSIARFMAATAVLCLNFGWIRAFLLTEGGWLRELFDPTFLAFFAFQFGSWGCLNATGRQRRFWVGFVTTGVSATLALTFVTVRFADFDNWYTGVASDLAYEILPSPVDVALTNEHWDWFLALIYFPPEWAPAVAVGLLAARPGRPTRSPRPEPRRVGLSA